MALSLLELPLSDWLESATSAFSEADAQIGSVDYLYIKSPLAGVAEERTFAVGTLSGRARPDWESQLGRFKEVAFAAALHIEDQPRNKDTHKDPVLLHAAAEAVSARTVSDLIQQNPIYSRFIEGES